ncbi:Spata13 protein [Pelomyxa schiedti]|nr:Spata13 protein [Pelomyxa schiedti]
MVVEELVTTEKKYLEDLYTLIVYYVRPIRTQFPELLQTAQMGSVLAEFSTAQLIFDLNTDLYSELSKAYSESDDSTIGQIFLKMASQWDYYAVYCNHQEDAVSKLETLESSNAQFSTFLQKCRAGTHEKLRLQDFVVKPFQRLLKYPLLLQSLLKYTSPTHSDYDNISKALQSMEATISAINTNKTHSDNLKKLLLINSLVVSGKHFTFVQPDRKYVMEGNLTKICNKPRQRKCFLFSDAFVYCKELMSGKLKVGGVILIEDLEIEDIPDTKTYSNALKFIHEDKCESSTKSKPSTRIHIICCSDTFEKGTWLKALLDLKQPNQSKQLRRTSSEACPSHTTTPPKLSPTMSLPSTDFRNLNDQVKSRAYSTPPPVQMNPVKAVEISTEIDNVEPMQSREGDPSNIECCEGTCTPSKPPSKPPPELPFHRITKSSSLGELKSRGLLPGLPLEDAAPQSPSGASLVTPQLGDKILPSTDNTQAPLAEGVVASTTVARLPRRGPPNLLRPVNPSLQHISMQLQQSLKLRTTPLQRAPSPDSLQAATIDPPKAPTTLNVPTPQLTVSPVSPPTTEDAQQPPVNTPTPVRFTHKSRSFSFSTSLLRPLPAPQLKQPQTPHSAITTTPTPTEPAQVALPVPTPQPQTQTTPAPTTTTATTTTTPATTNNTEDTATSPCATPHTSPTLLYTPCTHRPQPPPANISSPESSTTASHPKPTPPPRLGGLSYPPPPTTTNTAPPTPSVNITTTVPTPQSRPHASSDI